MDEVREEVGKCTRDIAQERERIDEEKMTRLELEGEIRHGLQDRYLKYA